MKIAAKIAAVLLIVFGVGFGLYLCFWVMLYGGIMQAVNSWGVNNNGVAWGIIRAILCQFGLLPGVVCLGAGLGLWENDD